MKIIRNMKTGQLIEFQVYLGEAERTPARLILEKLPEEMAAEKRRKLKTDKQNKRKFLSEDRIEFCVVNAFVTNIPEKVLPTENVRIIYTVRWQIEIVFKTWKSIFGLKDVTNINPYRLACMFYGALIKILIAIKVFWVFKLLAWHEREKELSEIKAMKILAERTESLFGALISDKPQFNRYWEELNETLIRFATKGKRRGKLFPFQILRLFSLT